MSTIRHKDVPRETFELADELIQKKSGVIEKYIEKLFWWNEKINLISRDVSRETIREHIRHSLLVSQLDVFKEASLIVDAGTGGGLPAIPLAITHPDKAFILNDIVSKKIMAVKQMAREFSLGKVKTVDKSIEALQVKQKFLLISKHAFKIKDLYTYTDHLPWRFIVLYKSVDITSELEGLKASLDITIHKLYPNSCNSFYKGKGIIIIKR